MVANELIRDTIHQVLGFQQIRHDDVRVTYDLAPNFLECDIYLALVPVELIGEETVYHI